MYLTNQGIKNRLSGTENNRWSPLISKTNFWYAHFMNISYIAPIFYKYMKTMQENFIAILAIFIHLIFSNSKGA